MQLGSSLSILWHCLSLGLEWKLTFSSPVATAEFSEFLDILSCSTFTASSFRIWNSSSVIPSPPLALFVVMVSKAHLTSHSRMSGVQDEAGAKANRVLPRKCTGHSKQPLPTTWEKTLHMNITRWSILKSDWLYSLQPKMEKLYTVSKNKTGSWLWLRSWTPYCQIQT